MARRRIKNRPLAWVAVAALAMAACGDDDPVAVEATGDPKLGTLTIETGGGISAVFDGFDIVASLLGAPDLVLLELNISDNDHGDPRKRNALLMDSSHPSFAAVVARLTDGADGTLHVQYLGVGMSSTGPVSALIDFDIERPGGEPDFVGYEVTALRWSVVQANFDSPGNDNNGDGIWTDFDMELKIDVEGRPE